jgi:hypothetical protein
MRFKHKYLYRVSTTVQQPEFFAYKTNSQQVLNDIKILPSLKHGGNLTDVTLSEFKTRAFCLSGIYESSMAVRTNSDTLPKSLRSSVCNQWRSWVVWRPWRVITMADRNRYHEFRTTTVYWPSFYLAQSFQNLISVRIIHNINFLTHFTAPAVSPATPQFAMDTYYVFFQILTDPSTLVLKRISCSTRQRNTKARSRNHCCYGKTISIKYSMCARACAYRYTYISLVIQHAKRICLITLSYVASLAPSYSSTLSHKRHDFRNKNDNTTHVFWFSLQRLPETFITLRTLQPEIIINVRKMPVILVRF